MSRSSLKIITQAGHVRMCNDSFHLYDRGHKKQSTQSSSKTSENNAWAGTKGMLCSCHKEAYRLQGYSVPFVCNICILSIAFFSGMPILAEGF